MSLLAFFAGLGDSSWSVSLHESQYAYAIIDSIHVWTLAGFIVMVITGSLLFSAIPLRSYQNIFFRTKMILLVLAGLNVWLFHSGTYKRIGEWDFHAIPPKAARIAGGISL